MTMVTMPQVGKLLVSSGGVRRGRALRSLQVLFHPQPSLPGQVLGPSSSVWRSLSSLPSPLADHCTASIGDGQILVTGGRGGEDRALKHDLRSGR